MSEQTCGAMILIRIGNAYEHFDQNDYDTAICGLPIQGSGACADCQLPAGTNWHREDWASPTRHPYQPSTWEHVYNEAMSDQYRAAVAMDHPATPTRET